MESIWRADVEIRKREALPGEMRVPVVVIGAGLAGILTAYYLKLAGIRAVVLEADRIGSGQTGNTTAKITSQHNLLYDRLIRTFGHEMAGQYARANESAIGEYERLIREKEIDCDFLGCPACLYSRTEEALLRREAEAAESLGIKASFGTDSELPFSVAGVVRFENQARFHPLKFLAAVAEEVEVYVQTKVLKAEGMGVETARGCVEAEHIVFAAHFPFHNVPGYYFARMYQERSYVEALAGAETLEGMYLGIDREGLSFRSQGDLLLLGGGSHRTGVNKRGRKDPGNGAGSAEVCGEGGWGGSHRTGVNKGGRKGTGDGAGSAEACGEGGWGGSHRTGMNKRGRKEPGNGAGSAEACGEGRYGMLFSRAREFYPECREAARWSAQDCMTLDGIPYIGRFSRRKPDWYVATGFGKWGMTTAMVSARVLTALISGKECPEADIFSPERQFTVRAVGELAVHGAYTVKGLSKHLLPSGKGKVIPNCPHMGCRLKWNPDEESYDCPCHGSRFDREGHLLDGPAQTDCKRRE